MGHGSAPHARLTGVEELVVLLLRDEHRGDLAEQAEDLDPQPIRTHGGEALGPAETHAVGVDGELRQAAQ